MKKCLENGHMAREVSGGGSVTESEKGGQVVRSVRRVVRKCLENGPNMVRNASGGC